MSGKLANCKVAILAVDGFEEAELVEPQRALSAEGAQVDVISQQPGEIQGFRHVDKGARVKVDHTFDDAKQGDYDAIVLPGGVVNGDAMRMIPAAREFVTAAIGADKPVAVICHGGWLLVSAGLVDGRTMTSWPSLQDDIRNAGGKWVDERVVRDGNLITSRKPDDLDAFNGALNECLAADRAHAPRERP
ncbi:type 1 glutamine amidotransferase domain-containing protein [Burkholderia multivorans]|nr:type 1 glutamine amidotransferase domain-containing protein [Burkholderia multivorans]